MPRHIRMRPHAHSIVKHWNHMFQRRQNTTCRGTGCLRRRQTLLESSKGTEGKGGRCVAETIPWWRIQGIPILAFTLGPQVSPLLSPSLGSILLSRKISFLCFSTSKVLYHRHIIISVKPPYVQN